MLELLRHSIQIESLSGQEGRFTGFIQDWAKKEGFETDLWESDEKQICNQGQVSCNHIPISGRPTLVVRLGGRGSGPKLMLNAHSDVVCPGALENWKVKPFDGVWQDGKVYGRGACDAKGPLVAGLWAMVAVRQSLPRGLAGDIMLELVPGEEDCVGIGTMTSITRGYSADAAIVLEPTENIPRRASRGGLRFGINCRGKAVHGTVKWLGKDAIVKMRKVLDALDILQQRWNDRKADPLFANYPITRPITVDKITGGKWQGMVCDECRCQGYIELLPMDEHTQWKNLFIDELNKLVGTDGVEIYFGEEYLGHITPAENNICTAAEAVMKSISGKDKALKWDGWSGFNSGCEAGVRANLEGTATLVWGPGSVSQAHAPDEFVNFNDVETAAELIVKLIVYWSNMTRQK